MGDLNFAELLADPARARELPPGEAEKMLLALAPVMEVLRLRAVRGSASANGERERSPADRLLSPAEAATFLGLTIEQLARRRGIPRKKLGRRTVRYSLTALQRYLARGA